MYVPYSVILLRISNGLYIKTKVECGMCYVELAQSNSDIARRRPAPESHANLSNGLFQCLAREPEVKGEEAWIRIYPFVKTNKKLFVVSI